MEIEQKSSEEFKKLCVLLELVFYYLANEDLFLESFIVLVYFEISITLLWQAGLLHDLMLTQNGRQSDTYGLSK